MRKYSVSNETTPEPSTPANKMELKDKNMPTTSGMANTITESQPQNQPQKITQETPKNVQNITINITAYQNEVISKLKQLRKNIHNELNKTRNMNRIIKKAVETELEIYHTTIEEYIKKTIPTQEKKDSIQNNTKDDNTENIKNIIQEQTEKMNQTNEKLEELGKTLEGIKESLGNKTYASVTASYPKSQPLRQTLHSVIVTSKTGTDTGHELMNKITEEIKTKGKEIKIDKIRKAKDRKVILSCSTEEDKRKLKEKIEEAQDQFTIEDIKNKNPLVILRNVINTNSDEDIIGSVRERNKSIFKDIESAEMEIAYKKRTVNNMKMHVVLRVSPILWKRMTEKGHVYTHMQKVTVWDQSPLIQCSTCLGYGHGKKYCKESEEGEKCSHCGGQHHRKACEEIKEGKIPTCINCKKAKINDVKHSAFSQECTIRNKWEDIARASIAYC